MLTKSEESSTAGNPNTTLINPKGIKLAKLPISKIPKNLVNLEVESLSVATIKTSKQRDSIKRIIKAPPSKFPPVISDILISYQLYYFLSTKKE